MRAGQAQVEAVDNDPLLIARGGGTVGPVAGRREDLDLVAGPLQVVGEVGNLHLDAPQPGQEAVRQEGDLHALKGAMGKDGHR